jgi:hypothetical protein
VTGLQPGTTPTTSQSHEESLSGLIHWFHQNPHDLITSLGSSWESSLQHISCFGGPFISKPQQSILLRVQR